MRISALKKCFCDIRDRVIALENKVDVDTDNQVISLSGNVLTLSGGLVPDTTVDLSSFLDNTDDQVLSANLTGTNLVLTISWGNTVTVPLASIDTDNQTLTLAGTNLSIQDGNTIDLSSFLDNTDDQQIQTFNIVWNTLTLTLEDGGTQSVDLSPYLDNTDSQAISLVGNNLTLQNWGVVDLSVYLDNTDNQILTNNDVVGVTTSISIGWGNTIPINHPTQTLNTTTEDIIVWHGSAFQNVWTTVIARGWMTVTRTNIGRYTVSMPAHPDGANYEILFGQDEDANRDVPKVHVVEGSRTATGFLVEVTVDDNGGAEDTYSDEPFSVEVLKTQTVITSVTLV